MGNITIKPRCGRIFRCFDVLLVPSIFSKSKLPNMNLSSELKELNNPTWYFLMFFWFTPSTCGAFCFLVCVLKGFGNCIVFTYAVLCDLCIFDLFHSQVDCLGVFFMCDFNPCLVLSSQHRPRLMWTDQEPVFIVYTGELYFPIIM